MVRWLVHARRVWLELVDIKSEMRLRVRGMENEKASKRACIMYDGLVFWILGDLFYFLSSLLGWRDFFLLDD